MKAIFSWDYNTWCRCHYYGEFGHIRENCVKYHMRKRDTTKRCFVCTKLGYLANNCMNQGRIQDGKKEKVDNIIKKMRHQWVEKFLENERQRHEVVETQVNELGDTTIST